MLTDLGQRRAARIVARMPSGAGGVLDPRYVDDLMIRVHGDLQRLSQELRFAPRVADLLGPLVAGVRAAAGGGTVRVVDVGCGVGYLVRWLAETSALGSSVELVGIDLNATLVNAAARLAPREGRRCQFVQADAFAPGAVIEDGSRTVVISSGLLHHLDLADLNGFFAAQARLGVAAFAHWDLAPCLWSTLGAWVLLRARMREPVSRHDGVMSARRAHPAAVLLATARAGAPGYASRVPEGNRWRPRAADVVRPIMGISGAIRADGFPQREPAGPGSRLREQVGGRVRVASRSGDGKARLDHRVDQLESLVEADERAFHRVQRQPLHVVPAVAELRRQQRELR
jgi:SAM-dependent methyltransferase